MADETGVSADAPEVVPSGDGTPAAEVGGSAETAPDADLAKQLEEAIADRDKWKDLSRRNEAKAKANRDAQAELERVKREAMSEQERAVADAAAAAKSEAMKAFGEQLVVAELRAQAAGKLSDAQVMSLSQAIDVSRFLGDDGAVKVDDLGEFVAGFVPVAPPAPPAPSPMPAADIGQGAGRGSPSGLQLGDDDGLGAALAAAVGALR